MSSTDRDTVFICYAHRDRKFLDELHEHLAPALRANTIKEWDDTRLKGGEDWREEIRKTLASANVAICLVSSAFQASRFIAENELPPLLTAAKAEGVTILPVIVGQCDFAESELAGVQALNEPSKPLNSMRPYQRNAIWVQVVRRVRDLLSQSSTASAATTPTEAQSGEINRLGPSMSPSELVAYAAQLNKEERYDEAVQVLKPLTQPEARNEYAWLEYTYALAKAGNQVEAVGAFVRAYNLYRQRERPGINDVKFPHGLRYAVFAGTISGTYSHGLTKKPNDIQAVGRQGTNQIVIDAVGSTTVSVTNSTAEPWVAVARQLNDTQTE
jgi:tetratricopeptide (TPR) repeat protein